VTGLVVDSAGPEMLAGDERIGSRRSIESADVKLLSGLAGRYVRVLPKRCDAGVLVELGRELYSWLDRDQARRMRCPGTSGFLSARYSASGAKHSVIVNRFRPQFEHRASIANLLSCTRLCISSNIYQKTCALRGLDEHHDDC
jgi:hypothetical protein